MKVGTDGVLLGACALPPGLSVRACDVGTGTGLVALMLAQRFPNLYIDAIDVDKDAAIQARHNCAVSPFKDRIHVYHAGWAAFEPSHTYDWVVSNPPFHVEDVDATGARYQARQATALPPQQLVTSALRHLHAHGRITIIAPPGYVQACTALLLREGWYLAEVQKWCDRPQRDPYRWLASWEKNVRPLQISIRYIRNEAGEYAKDFKDATRAFYLNASLEPKH